MRVGSLTGSGRGGAAGRAALGLSIGLAAAASYWLLKGLAGLLARLGASLWQADVVAGVLGLAVAVLWLAVGGRRPLAGGLTPSQAIAQLRTEFDVAPAVPPDRRAFRPAPAAQDLEVPS